jgi:hypothetical protein
MREEFQLALQSLRDSWLQVSAWLPRLLVAFLLLLLGWLVARSVQRGVVRLLRLLRLESAAEHTGVEDFLIRGRVRFTAVTLIGQFFYWTLLLIVTMAAFNVLGVRLGSALVEQFADYVPNLLAALAILVFGALVARFLRGLTETYLSNIGVKTGTGIALLVQAAALAFVVILALEQLGVAVALLVSAFQLAFGGLCLALALAFGLGGRGWAEGILARTRSTR